MSDEQDLLAGGGPKLPSLKFEKIGDVHTGVVTDVKKLEDRDPAGVAKTWPNGDPRFVYVITLKTEKDGDANLWARGAMITAIREAAKTIGVTELGWSGFKPNFFLRPRAFSSFTSRADLIEVLLASCNVLLREPY